jgi:hypothetical protein
MGFAALSVVTRHLRDALQLVDIRALDHLIVAGDKVMTRKPGPWTGHQLRSGSQASRSHGWPYSTHRSPWVPRVCRARPVEKQWQAE